MAHIFFVNTSAFLNLPEHCRSVFLQLFGFWFAGWLVFIDGLGWLAALADWVGWAGLTELHLRVYLCLNERWISYKLICKLVGFMTPGLHMLYQYDV